MIFRSSATIPSVEQLSDRNHLYILSHSSNVDGSGRAEAAIINCGSARRIYIRKLCAKTITQATMDVPAFLPHMHVDENGNGPAAAKHSCSCNLCWS